MPKCYAHNVVNDLNPFTVWTYPTRPTTHIGGVSIIVTASTTSFLSNSDLGLWTSLRICVIPALIPGNAVRCGGNV